MVLNVFGVAANQRMHTNQLGGVIIYSQNWLTYEIRLIV